MEDEKILDLYFARDEQAIAETQRRYGGLCAYISGNILRNESDAEECVNDVWLALWNKIPPERPRPFISYIAKVARNITLKRYAYNTAEKRNSYYDASLDEMEETLASAGGPESEIEASELTEAINAFLDGQTPENRYVFVSRFWFSDSYETIAERPGLTVKNVSVKLVRLRKALREYLEARGFFNG